MFHKMIQINFQPWKLHTFLIQLSYDDLIKGNCPKRICWRGGARGMPGRSKREFVVFQLR